LVTAFAHSARARYEAYDLNSFRYIPIQPCFYLHQLNADVL